MTEHEVLGQVLSCIDPSASSLRLVSRNGRILMGLPLAGREAGARALGLYQPQRLLARGLVTALRGLSRMGLQDSLLPKGLIQTERMDLSPALSGIDPGTCGVLLGSPEHLVTRAIASYRINGQWEVAKISFGEEGRNLLEREAHTLEELQSVASGVPALLGLHRCRDATILRMPYLEGDAIPIGRFAEALELLEGWVGELPEKPVTAFPEWRFIESSVAERPGGKGILQRLSLESLRPVICHGDFTRWNLRTRKNDTTVVLDWEWGHSSGMPGIDLVHYFLQDHRLVKRMSPEDAIRATISDMDRPECSEYLRRTGWGDDRMLPIIACLAWKEGAEHQDNTGYLNAAVELILDV